jgi:hypothetical protein
MGIRYIDTKKLVFEYLRPNYSLTNFIPGSSGAPAVGQKLNALYKYIYCLVSPFVAALSQYYVKRDKMYALASCESAVISMQKYLNKYYNPNNLVPGIVVGSEQAETVYFWDYSSSLSNSVLMYPYNSTPLMLYHYGASSNTATITIPISIYNVQSLKEGIIADLNTICLYGIGYAIKTTA